MKRQDHESQESLVKRIEDLADILQGSVVGEIELAEGGTEIIIRRQSEEREEVFLPQRSVRPASIDEKSSTKRSGAEDKSIAIIAPLTGVFYTSPSPGLPPFIQAGDTIQLEQVVALIEAMKVFNEIQAHVAGRLTQIVAVSGAVVKKGDVLFRVEPL